MSIRLFSSESVTEGHPDKVCDQISDSILDALLAVDPASRVAVETVVTRGLVHVVGEVTTEAYVEIPALVRQTLTRIGYGDHQFGFDGANCGVSVSLGAQSPDIAAGVFNETDQGAGDQGIMFGYASNETQNFMPLPIWLAHRLAERLAEVRKSGQLPYLGPDGKTQVTIGYEGNSPRTIDAIVVSTQHLADVDLDTLRAEVAAHVIEPVLSTVDIEHSAPRLFINHMGKFVAQDYRRYLRRSEQTRWWRL
jgi:S-adenosylmethionine synthetase